MNHLPFRSTIGKTITPKMLRAIALIALAVLGLSLLAPVKVIAAGPATYTGTINGAAYLIDMPANWNGTLLLYSHGYVPPGSPNPAIDAGDPATKAVLLTQGYALAGSSYSTTGWAVAQAFQDQTALLDEFDALVGHPKRTIAWGHSLGGIITAGLVQKYPQRFAGALPMCGVLAGAVGTWNEALDTGFAFKTLVAPSSALELVHISNPSANYSLAASLFATAQATPQGRARIALVAALGDLPGWFSASSPEPAATDYATRELNQYLWIQQVDALFEFAFRADVEARAGGNPSWNTGVNYEKQLERSVDHDEVVALYAQAGLSLDQDLTNLAHAPRISADAGAVDYLEQNIVFNGEIKIPVLTMHTTGDGLVVVEDEQAYASVVRSAGQNRLLRETFVHRAGHCTFTPAETMTTLNTLLHRLDTGQWGDTDATTMDAGAVALGAALNPIPPAFVDFEPLPFLRPFDSRGSGSAFASYRTDRRPVVPEIVLPVQNTIRRLVRANPES